jgi:hypothetical protein
VGLIINQPDRAGVPEPRLKILGKNLGQTDKQTDNTKYRVALRLKKKSYQNDTHDAKDPTFYI